MEPFVVKLKRDINHLLPVFRFGYNQLILYNTIIHYEILCISTLLKFINPPSSLNPAQKSSWNICCCYCTNTSYFHYHTLLA